MPRVQAGELNIAYTERGHGQQRRARPSWQPGMQDWLDLVLPLLPTNIRVIAADWRGCGDSDKPDPLPDYSNYSMAAHADDMLALLDALSIERCHLYGHSTGGIICSHMLVAQPGAFFERADARSRHAARTATRGGTRRDAGPDESR